MPVDLSRTAKEIHAVRAGADDLGPDDLGRLAQAWDAAERHLTQRVRRSVIRHMALGVDAPGVVDHLRDLLEISERVTAVAELFDVDADTAESARAAALDAAVGVWADGRLSSHAVAALVAPWERARRHRV